VSEPQHSLLHSRKKTRSNPSLALWDKLFCHCPCAELRTQRQRAQGLWPPSNRLGREAGFVMTCFLAALAMGPISPLLPLAALAYFILMWTFWRYTVRVWVNADQYRKPNPNPSSKP